MTSTPILCRICRKIIGETTTCRGIVYLLVGGLAEPRQAGDVDYEQLMAYWNCSEETVSGPRHRMGVS